MGREEDAKRDEGFPRALDAGVAESSEASLSRGAAGAAVRRLLPGEGKIEESVRVRRQKKEKEISTAVSCRSRAPRVFCGGGLRRTIGAARARALRLEPWRASFGPSMGLSPLSSLEFWLFGVVDMKGRSSA